MGDSCYEFSLDLQKRAIDRDRVVILFVMTVAVAPNQEEPVASSVCLSVVLVRLFE